MPQSFGGSLWRSTFGCFCWEPHGCFGIVTSEQKSNKSAGSTQSVGWHTRARGYWCQIHGFQLVFKPLKRGLEPHQTPLGMQNFNKTMNQSAPHNSTTLCHRSPMSDAPRLGMASQVNCVLALFKLDRKHSSLDKDSTWRKSRHHTDRYSP